MALLQSTEAARSPIHTSRAWSVMPMAAVLVASAGVGFGRPFRSNQNSYLLHAVGPSLSSLRDDWLLHTTDPLPIFTAVARLASDRAGPGRFDSAEDGFGHSADRCPPFACCVAAQRCVLPAPPHPCSGAGLGASVPWSRRPISDVHSVDVPGK